MARFASRCPHLAPVRPHVRADGAPPAGWVKPVRAGWTSPTAGWTA